MPFEERKATEVAAYFLRLAGGRMPYLKLIKLLYLADREALHQWGNVITTDRHVSMPHGPVVSNTYNLMIDDRNKPFWSIYISAPVGEYELELLRHDCPIDRLSRAEERLIQSVYARYGRMNKWRLRDYTHELPEWRDPNGSSLPIELEDILAAQGVEATEAESISEALRAHDREEAILGPAF